VRVATVTDEALVEYMSRWFHAWTDTLEVRVSSPRMTASTEPKRPFFDDAETCTRDPMRCH
jgi:hypothetical protein